MKQKTRANDLFNIVNLILLVGIVLLISCLLIFDNNNIVYADEEIDINISESHLENEYDDTISKLYIRGTVSFRDLPPTSIYSYYLRYKKASESADQYKEYPGFTPVDGDSSFDFYFGNGLSIGEYTFLLRVQTTILNEGTFTGQQEINVVITKANIPERFYPETCRIVYGQHSIADSSIPMFNDNLTWTWTDDVDTSEVLLPGTYIRKINITPRSENYNKAFAFPYTIIVEKRTIISLITNTWSMLGDPQKELIVTPQNLDSVILPGDENSYTISLALEDRFDVNVEGEYYIIGTVTSDFYQGLFVNSDNPDGNVNVPGIYRVVKQIKTAQAIDNSFNELRLYMHDGFFLQESFELEKASGSFILDEYMNDYLLLGEYKIKYFYDGQRRNLNPGYIFDAQLYMPDKANKHIIILARNGSNVIVNEIKVDGYGRASFLADYTGEFAVLQLIDGEEPPSPPIIKPTIVSDDVIYVLVGIGSAIATLLLLGSVGLFINIVKKK